MEGDLTGNAHSAYARLLDDNPDLEAVFCVNDETAAGFYEELKARGLMPGRDISVFGYDDTSGVPRFIRHFLRYVRMCQNLAAKHVNCYAG